MAASPETSLRVILEQTFINDVKTNGKTLKGTDRDIATLVFGASSIVDHGKFIDVAATAGLTDDSLDYAVEITLDIRFDVPSFSL